MKKKSPFAPKKLKAMQIIAGINISVTCCGLKKNNKDDLVLIKLDKRSPIHGFFTKSYTPGEPVKWNKSIINVGYVSAILINSGNANVFTGDKGRKSLEKIISKLSELLGINSKEIYIASTGVIGEYLDEKKIISAFPRLIENLSNKSNQWEKAANAIRTTDTFSKLDSVKYKSKDFNFLINGIAKGSGMIAPNMATMLSFVFTNAVCNKRDLKKPLKQIINNTFNSITVDSDTSTSDMVLFISVRSKKEEKIQNAENFKKFLIFLEKLMTNLAVQIVQDGEGANKFVTVNVHGAKSKDDAKTVAMSIANSPLVKTAIAGSDSNWGRIVMAIGKSGVEVFAQKVSISFGKNQIIKNGNIIKNVTFNKLDQYFKNKKIEINVNLGMKNGSSRVWTCDYTKDYISINADYRS